MSEPRASQAGALWLRRALLEHGVRENKIRSVCDIDFDRISMSYPFYRFPISNLRKLFAFAAEQLDDPAIALHLAQARFNEAHNLRTAAASSAPTNVDAMTTWAKYSTLDLTDHVITVEHVPSDNELTLHAKQSAHIPDAWLSELFIGTAKSLMAWFTNNRYVIVRAGFEHSAPAYVEEYRNTLCRELFFEQKLTSVTFRSRRLEDPAPNASRYIHRVFCKEADRVLAELYEGPISTTEVKQLIFFGLERGEASASLTAERLDIDRSTLARQLRQRGTSFSKLLAEVRKESALRLLKLGYSVREVAAELAYSEPSAFQHAFQRWYDMSPKRYCERVLTNPEEAADIELAQN